MLSRLSLNTFILMLSNILTAGLAFLLTLLIGRGLGDTGLGRYAAVMAWIFPLTILADFGVSTLITRDVAENHRRTAAYIRQALFWRWALAGGLVLLLWIGTLAATSRAAQGLRIASFLILIDSLFGIYTAVWRAWQIMWPILLLNTGLLSLQVAGAALVLWQGGGLNAVLVVLVLADAIQLGAAWLLWRFKFYRPVPQAEKIIHWKFLKKALPFAAGGLLAAVYSRMIFLILETYTHPEVVGWFAAASRFVEAAKMPALALFGAIFPVLAALSRDSAALQNLMKKMNMGLAVYAFCGAAAFTLLSQPILDVTFGQHFQKAVPILMLLSWTLIPSLLRQSFAAVHYALHYENRVNKMMLVALPVQGIAGMVLIKMMGGRGAAWTLLCSESLLMVGLWQSYRKLSHANRDSDTGVFSQ